MIGRAGETAVLLVCFVCQRKGITTGLTATIIDDDWVFAGFRCGENGFGLFAFS